MRALLEWLDDLLFPERVLCLACGRALDEDEHDGLCPHCASALEALAEKQAQEEARQSIEPSQGLAYVHAAFPYEAQARRLVRQLKYSSVRAAAVPLAREMAMLPSGEETLLVPVPTDRKRERRRGYNQAAVLAQHIGDTLGMPVEDVLERTQSRRPQTGLTAMQRKKNLVGCMRAKRSVKGAAVVLVDDVYTTGSTAQEAARALLEAGAASVGMFVAAKAAGSSDPVFIHKE